MENYDYWITVYSVIFTLLIASLSINSIFFIKDKINKVLSCFVFSGIYALVLSYFFEKSSIGYTQQEVLPTFIYKGYNAYLFHGNIYLLCTLVALIILVVRLLISRKNRSIFPIKNND